MVTTIIASILMDLRVVRNAAATHRERFDFREGRRQLRQLDCIRITKQALHLYIYLKRGALAHPVVSEHY